MTALQYLDMIAPQFVSRTDKADFVSLARLRVQTAYYGDTAEYAVALWAAHMITLTVNAQTGAGGAVASKSEGDLSISYHNVSNLYGELGLTSYGQQLAGLRKGQLPIMSVTGGNLETIS